MSCTSHMCDIAELENAVRAAGAGHREKHTLDLGGLTYIGTLADRHMWMPSNCTLCNRAIVLPPESQVSFGLC